VHPLILVLNAGSSSLKFAVHEDAADLPRVLKGSVSGLSDAPRLKIVFTDGRPPIDDRAGESSMDGSQALSRVFAELRGASLMERVAAVGHRIVHGGKAFTGPTRLDASTLDALRRLVPLAPLAMLLRSEDARAR
jgi:acetate kinase